LLPPARTSAQATQKLFWKIKRKMSIKWFGHAAFSITSASKEVVLIDPWLNNPKAPADSVDSLKDSNIVAILLSHSHFDHVGDTLDLLRAHPKAKVYGELAKPKKHIFLCTLTGMATTIAIHELSLWLKDNGIGDDQVVGLNKVSDSERVFEIELLLLCISTPSQSLCFSTSNMY
jgi:ribonuclease BN (tRNA processing enzyme)